jgi:hypothetical protein
LEDLMAPSRRADDAKPTVTIQFKSGVAVQGPGGESLSGGPHEVPEDFATMVIGTGQAVRVEKPARSGR